MLTPTFINAIIVFALALTVTIICIPLVIKLAIKKRLLGVYGEGRHVHKGFTPRLGGVAIYTGFLFSQVYFLISEISSNENIENYLLLLFGVLLMFLLGILDDLVNLKALLKFIVQLLVAIILVWNADIRVESFHGILGIDTLPIWVSYLFSVLVITFFINAYNLIDGLDSLSSSVGIYVLTCFTWFFLLNGNHIESMLAFSTMGALIGFWLFNKPPAKIFMGDSGSLSIGLLLAFFAIRISNLPLDAEGSINPVFAMVVMAYPIIDTLRVFTLRIYNGRSPFSPDRNHIHHVLLDLGLSHGRSTIVIVLFSLLFSIIAYILRMNLNLSFIVLVLLMLFVSLIPSYLLRKHNEPKINKL